MIVVNVSVRVKPGMAREFISATIENAQNSIKEPGISRFDFMQQNDDPSSFLLVEVYKNDDASLKHKETPHYNIWRNTVESMMAAPRKSTRYTNIFPEDKNW